MIGYKQSWDKGCNDQTTNSIKEEHANMAQTNERGKTSQTD